MGKPRVIVSVALCLGWLGVASIGAAQSRRAAQWVEGDEGQAAAVRVIVRGALSAAGYTLEDSEAVAAARAFVSSEASLDDASAARLREALGVEVLWVVRLAPVADGAMDVALRRVAADGVRADDGTVGADGLGGFVVERVIRIERESAEPVATIEPTVGPEPLEPTPDAAPIAVEPQTVAPPSTPSSTAASARASDFEPPVAPARTMRVRLALLGVAGINGYGYGAAARLLLPLARVGRGDDALSFGIDLGATYDETAIDVVPDGIVAEGEVGSVYHLQRSFQLPITVSLAWRVDTGAVVVTPRVGLVGVLRISGVEGPVIQGFRMDGLLMGLLGLSLGVWVDDLQIFLGADVMAGPRRDVGADNDTMKDFSRFGLLLSAGVAL